LEKTVAFKHEKIVEEIGLMSVIDLSDLIKAIETKFGVSAAAPVAAASTASVGAVAETAAQSEKSEYKVTLKDGGAEKIKVIKAVRQVVPGLSLSDAKKLVEEAPSVIAEAASKDDAQKMKAALEEAGAKVELA
jgi:large subunit ribosomal protein L7/L12